MNHNFKKVIAHAIQNINNELRNHQEQILLKERFGMESVFYPDLYKPGETERAKSVFGSIEADYKELLAFGTELQKILNEANERDLKEAAKSFFGTK